MDGVWRGSRVASPRRAGEIRDEGAKLTPFGNETKRKMRRLHPHPKDVLRCAMGRGMSRGWLCDREENLVHFKQEKHEFDNNLIEFNNILKSRNKNCSKLCNEPCFK